MTPSTFKLSSAASPNKHDLTTYFSPSPKKRERRSLGIDNSENEINSVARKRQRSLSGAATSRLNLIEIDKNSTMLESGVALVRIHDANTIPTKQCARVGDPDTYLLRDKAILGRSLASCANSKSLNKKFRNQKIDLGIHGAGTGVSRKQLQVLKLEPLTLKQIKGATNQIDIQKYNPIQKKMERPITIEANQVFVLKFNDVLMMDGFKGNGSEYRFRVKKCLTPPLRARKHNRNTESEQNSPTQVVDLVNSGSVSYTPASVSGNGETRKNSRILSQRQMTTTNKKNQEKSDKKTKPLRKTEIVVSATSTKLIIENNQNKDKESCIANSMPLHAGATRTMTSKSSSEGTLVTPHELMPHLDTRETIGGAEGATKKPNTQKGGRGKSIVTSHVSKKRQNDDGAPNLLPETSEDCKGDKTTKIEVEQLDTALSSISRSPEVGSFFRVTYKTNDTFRVDGNERLYESWHLGKVQKVTKLRKKAASGESMYKLKLLFFDKTSRDLNFPGDDIQLIDNSDESGLLYALSPKGNIVDREKAFDRNPKKLMVGDLVDAHYQNGLDSDRWYRGRIAAVNTVSNSCTIAYDDGDIECLVPMNDGKIMLVERGCIKSNWLLNLGIYDDFDRKMKRKKKNIPNKEIGTVTRIDHKDEDVNITITFHSGVKMGCLCYKDFVAYLFESLLSRYNATKTWPAADSSSEKAPENPTEGHAKDLSPKQQERKPKNKKRVKKFCEEEWQTSKAEVPQSEMKMELKCMKEMHPTLSNSFFRALNTSEPILGTDLLIHTALFHNRGLNTVLGQNIRELLIDGPMSEGTNFPDAHRLETSIRYLMILSLTNEGRGNLVKFCCPEKWSPFQEMIQAIVEPCYTNDGDTSTSNINALGRISDSLHLGAVGAQFLAKLFDAELGDIVDQRTMKQNEYREGCLAKAMWSNENGPRQSLKELTKAFVQAWVHFGHYAVCTLPVEKDSSALALRRKCREDSKLLLKELGTILSYAIWLYSVIEKLHLNHKDVAYIIKDAFQAESVASPSDLGEHAHSYQVHLKLQLVLSLDSKLVTEVQINLANELGVKREYDLIVG